MEFPYPFREYQSDIIEDIRSAVGAERHLVLEAGLGSGKTICALYPTLDHALSNDRKILYLTRTNSQQKQVIHELRMLNVPGMGLQGRRNLCPVFKKDSKLMDGNPEELSKLCGDKKKEVFKGNLGACPYFAKSLVVDEDKIRKRLKKIPTVEEFSAYCRKRNLCAYELTKRFLKESNLVVAPYIYFFSPMVRKSLLEWMGAAKEDIVLIVDEAHNLVDYGRNLLTSNLSVKGLKLAEGELHVHGDSEVLDGMMATQLCRLLIGIIKKIKAEYLKEDDALIPRTVLEEEMYSKVGTSKKLKTIIKNLLLYGEMIRDLKRKNGRLPRSHIYRVGAFLERWVNLDDEAYVKVVTNRQNPTLQIYCLDPREATDVVRKCRSTIHMSGTLDPLEEYRDSIGLPEDTALKKYPSPFPPGNRALFYQDDVTTKFDEFDNAENLSRLRNRLKEISAIGRNTAIFFPSYDIMARFSDLGGGLGERMFIESRGIGQEELVRTIGNFKNARNSVLFAVIGGRISEGIDFPDEELELVVIVGIPYPKPSAKQRALVLYYDLKFKKGWDYAVRGPTIRKMHQAIGRLIRKADDKGVAVILDRRAAGFKSELKGLKKAKTIELETESFFTPR
jgi:DNA excision repair protein ERCC-2